MPDLTRGHTYSAGDSVTHSNLNNLVGNATINDNAITTSHIADDAVTGDKIGTGAVVTQHIGDSKVTTVKIDNNAVTAEKLGDLAVTTARLDNSAVTTNKIADDAITSEKIGDNQVSLPKLTHGTKGDILYYGTSGAPERLSAGTSGQFLKTQGSGQNPTWADVSIPSVTVSSDNTALDDDTDVTVPANTFLVIGTLRFAMSGSTGAKAEAQIKDSSGTVLDTVVLGGGNEGDGTDGGSGMTVRDSFTIGVPSNCATVRIYKGAGSNSMVGEVTQFVKLS